MIIDSAPLRKKARREYEKALCDLESAKAESERFQAEDKPGFSKWLHANFGAALTELRDLQTRLFHAQELVREVEMQFLWGDHRSFSAAYKEVLHRRNHPEEFAQEEAAEAEASEQARDARRSAENPFETFFDEDGDGDDEDKRFWNELHQGLDEQRRAQRQAQQARGGNRLKELYRRLARRLHPDKTRELSGRKLEWWHQTQAAYENGDVEQLETILSLIEVEERGTTETTISLLKKLTAEFKRSLRSLKRQLAEARKDIAWNFSQLTDFSSLLARARAMLEEDRLQLMRQILAYEGQIQAWQSTANRPRKRVRTARAAAEEEWF